MAIARALLPNTTPLQLPEITSCFCDKTLVQECRIMYDAQRTHPLLAQVPLTVSPFLSLPSAVTLPYTFRSVPASLPPSSVGEIEGSEKPRYVVSSSGHAAHPDTIIASCKALQEHVRVTQDNATKLIREWEDGIMEKELAEKRRVAPGWLDRDKKILEPTKATDPKNQNNLIDRQVSNEGRGLPSPTMSPTREGEELDRAFGGLGMR